MFKCTKLGIYYHWPQMFVVDDFGNMLKIQPRQWWCINYFMAD